MWLLIHTHTYNIRLNLYHLDRFGIGSAAYNIIPVQYTHTHIYIFIYVYMYVYQLIYIIYDVTARVPYLGWVALAVPYIIYDRGRN